MIHCCDIERGVTILNMAETLMIYNIM